MREKDQYAPNFLDQKDGAFKKLHGTMDTHFRSLRQQGVGAKIKHAKIISSEDEDLMWERGVMGITSPVALLQAVFYYNGKKILAKRWSRAPKSKIFTASMHFQCIHLYRKWLKKLLWRTGSDEDENKN